LLRCNNGYILFGLLLIIYIFQLLSFKGFLRSEVNGLQCYGCIDCDEPFDPSTALVQTCSQTAIACEVCIRK
jgi:hypothetical protein